MCGRFTLRAKLNLLLDQFAAELAAETEWEPRYNIPPTASVPAVAIQNDRRELGLLRWGLIPSWAKDDKLAQINARADTVAIKPMFRSAFKKRRCLIPADGYYEWLREGKEKQPFYYEVDGGKPFAMAGLYEWWDGPILERMKRSPEERVGVGTCAIITTEANELANEVHNRMPVILDPDDYAAWLACEDVPLVPLPSNRMSVRPVSKYVNKAGNEGEKCLESPPPSLF